MKKKLLLFALAAMAAIVCQVQPANAAKSSMSAKDFSHLFTKDGNKLIFGKPFLFYVGHIQDPGDPTVYYRLYGTGGVVSSATKVNASGAPLSGAVSVSGGHYTSSGGILHAWGTLHRTDSTTFFFDNIEEV